MPAPSYTYTLANSTTADASQVMQNFNDILNGVSDGTKDLSINALTCAGTATFNGNVTLGNATSDDLTSTGRWASDLDPKTAATYDFGDSTQTWRALYLDNGATDGGAVYFDAGTTKFLKSSADGTTLNIGGFTKIAPVDAEYKGRTTASAATAGYKGEVVTGACSADTAATSTSDTDVTGMSVALTAGVWLIGYNVCAATNNATGAATSTSGRVRITDSSNNALSNTEAYLGSDLMANNDRQYVSVSRFTVIAISSSTTYKVRIAGIASDRRCIVYATSITGSWSDPDNASVLFAVRIA